MMFITSKNRGYDRHGQQIGSGQFLAVFSHGLTVLDEPDHEKRAQLNRLLWGVVRYCKLTQCGHFMMGRFRLGNQKITISGTYGGDGLPMDLSKVNAENRKYLTQLPEELTDKFWAGGGHNCAGSEAWDMRDWGIGLLEARASRRKG